MALFNKSGASANHAANVAILAAGSRFTGTVQIDCALHIDGEFTGDIESRGAVLVGKPGVLKSHVRAHKLVVAGKFFGNADCDAVELVNGCLVEGNLCTASLAIEKGAIFKGKSTRKKPSAESVQAAKDAQEAEAGEGAESAHPGAADSAKPTLHAVDTGDKPAKRAGGE